MFIGLVGLALDPQVLLQSMLALKQPLRARARNRISREAAMLIKLMARLAQPPLTPLHPSDDRLGVKREPRGQGQTDHARVHRQTRAQASARSPPAVEHD